MRVSDSNFFCNPTKIQKMPILSINFDRENKFYFEGEKICANVELSVEETVNVSNILVYFVGECACSSERDPQTNSSKIKDREIYFDDVQPVFEAANKETSIFSKGVHQFSVEYQLPSTLPSSLESPQGYIRYSLHASADVGDDDFKCMQYFTVVSKVDLNNNDAANLPVVMWKNENQCIFFYCFRNGGIRAFVDIAKKGYVPGEMLTVNAEVLNFSRSPVHWVKAALVQILKYNYSKVEKRRRIVVELMRGCVMPQDNQTWQSENLFIPAIPPTTIPAKGLIHVKYKFYFSIMTSKQGKMITLKQNIIIGALPVLECKPTEEKGQGEGESVVNNCYPYSNLEPCIFGPHLVGEESSTSSFSPLYPMYVKL